MSHQLQLLNAHRQFNKLLSSLALGGSVEHFLQQVIHTVEEIIPECKASILFLDSSSSSLYSGSENRLPDFYNQAIDGVTIGEKIGSCGAAAYLNEAVIVTDINTHENWQDYLALTQQANLHACWSVPFCSPKNKVLGTFAIYHHQPKSPSPEEREIIDMAALITSVALEKQALEAKLNFAANHDELTKLHNRMYLNDAGEALLALCQRKKLTSSLLFIDLNKFKNVNDKLGHKAGDELLIEVANILKQQTRDADICARFGGDEFIILMQNECDDDGTLIANRIHKQLLNTISQEILSLGFGISIGVTTFSPKSPASLSKLINQADQAMYHAKKHALGVHRYKMKT